MKKLLLVSSAIVTSVALSQATFADTSLQLTNDDLIAASQGYILTGSDERYAPRRSALFAMIKDKTADATTVAQTEVVVEAPEG